MVHSIRIGDWDVRPLRETILGTIMEPRIQITYNFVYIPTGLSVMKTVTYAKLESDDEIIKILASKTEEVERLIGKEHIQ